MADKTELYLRRLLDKALEFCAIYEIAVSTEHSESAQIIFCQSAHFLDADVEIFCGFTDGQQIFLADRQSDFRFSFNIIHNASCLRESVVPPCNGFLQRVGKNAHPHLQITLRPSES